MSNPYSEEWQKLKTIAEDVRRLQERQRQLEEHLSRLESELDNLPYETDEDGNDIYESTREALYSQISSVNSLISEARYAEQQLSSTAYSMAGSYRQQASEFQQKASKASGAASDFQKLSGYRFGSTTASAGANLAQQRTSHYRDHAQILSDLASAAELAASGNTFSVNNQSISDRGSFQNPAGVQNVWPVRATGTRSRAAESLWSGAEGNSVKRTRDDLVGAAASGLGIQGISYSNGTPEFAPVSHAKVSTAGVVAAMTAAGVSTAAVADALLAKKLGISAEEAANYRKENGLEWRTDGSGQNAELIPQSFSNEYSEGKLSEKEPTPMDALTAYMWAHNYGKDDYDIYSKDPEWQKLHEAVFPKEKTSGFLGLKSTNQEIEECFLDGKRVTIFDHPFSGENNVICNQGSGWPDGPQQTCGCCADGTVMNKAGFNFTERPVVEFALTNGLCTEEGYTTPDSWIKIMEGMAGIPASNTRKVSLEDLAKEVEQGKGVIIGVSACTYDPSSYGKYNPFKSDGHALVLESVIRDAETGEILEYVVSDSNGRNRSDACRRVKKSTLEKAYKRMKMQSVATDVILW